LPRSAQLQLQHAPAAFHHHQPTALALAPDALQIGRGCDLLAPDPQHHVARLGS
jgi:hypothetical protein